MTQAANEIQRLRRLYQGADLELQLLTHRGYLTTAEQTRRRELRRRKLQLEDRMAWFEAILREHAATP